MSNIYVFQADKVYQEERGNHDASSKQYLPPPPSKHLRVYKNYYRLNSYYTLFLGPTCQPLTCEGLDSTKVEHSQSLMSK